MSVSHMVRCPIPLHVGNLVRKCIDWPRGSLHEVGEVIEIVEDCDLIVVRWCDGDLAMHPTWLERTDIVRAVGSLDRGAVR